MSGVSQSSLNEISIGTSPSIINVDTTVANGEVVVSIPSGARQFRLSIKDHTASYEIAFTSGGTTYFFSPGETYTEQNLVTGNLQLFVKVAKENKTIQVLYWT